MYKFRIHLNTYVMALRPYSVGIDFRRQNLTSVDVRFWRLKSIPAQAACSDSQ